jgi:hypothetical protein
MCAFFNAAKAPLITIRRIAMPNPPAKTDVPVTVNFTTSPITCAPDPVPVSKASNTGITWSTPTANFTFTGVALRPPGDTVDHDAPYGDFGTPDITSNAAGKSQMFVSDSGDTDTTDYKYTLKYKDSDNKPQSFDPTIRNKP